LQGKFREHVDPHIGWREKVEQGLQFCA